MYSYENVPENQNKTHTRKIQSLNMFKTGSSAWFPKSSAVKHQIDKRYPFRTPSGMVPGWGRGGWMPARAALRIVRP